MSELAAEEEIVPDEQVITPNPDEPGEPAPEGETPEEQARRMGWKPEEDYKGPDGKWVDAETFLNNTENDPEQLRRSLKTIERNYQKLEKGMEAVLSHQEREIESAREKAIEETRATNEAAFAQALEDGDEEKAQALYNKKSEVPAGDELDSKVVAWRKKNPYMDDDPVMSDAANRYADMQAKAGLPMDTVLAKTDEYMRKRFPNEFPEARKAADPVRAGGQNGVVVTKHQAEAGSYEALNQSSKAQCDGFVRSMVGKGFTKDNARANFLEYATDDMFK